MVSVFCVCVCVGWMFFRCSICCGKRRRNNLWQLRIAQKFSLGFVCLQKTTMTMAPNSKDTCNKEEQLEQGLRSQVRKRISPLPLQQSSIPEYLWCTRVSPGSKKTEEAGGQLIGPILDNWFSWDGKTNLQVEHNCSPSLFIRTPIYSKEAVGSGKDGVETTSYETILHTNNENAALQAGSTKQLLGKDEVMVREEGGHTNEWSLSSTGNRVHVASNNDEMGWLCGNNNNNNNNEATRRIDLTTMTGDIIQDEQGTNLMLSLNSLDTCGFQADALCHRAEQTSTTPVEEDRCFLLFSTTLNEQSTAALSDRETTSKTYDGWNSPLSSNETHDGSKRKSGKEEYDVRKARIMRNREAAQRSRQNAKAKFQWLEEENQRLRGSLYALEQENLWLRKQVEMVKECLYSRKKSALNKYDIERM